MKRNRGDWLTWLAGDLPGEGLPGQSLLELSGDKQLLIENHRGVTSYHRECIGIRTTFGELMIHGRELELAHMTQGQLVVSGLVDAIELRRRCP